MSNQKRLVSTFVPAVPCWAIYGDIGENTSLFADPVIAFAVWEITESSRGEVDCYSETYPMVLTQDGISEEGGEDGASNFLGLSLTATPKEEDWRSELDRCRARFARIARKS